MVDMAACMEKEGVGSYARQGCAGGDGVWEWDSRTPVSPGSQSRGSKRQLGGAEGEGLGGMRGWVEDEEEEAERKQQRRQQQY